MDSRISIGPNTGSDHPNILPVPLFPWDLQRNRDVEAPSRRPVLGFSPQPSSARRISLHSNISKRNIVTICKSRKRSTRKNVLYHYHHSHDHYLFVVLCHPFQFSENCQMLSSITIAYRLIPLSASLLSIHFSLCRWYSAPFSLQDTTSLWAG